MNEKYFKWDISKGDYERDHEDLLEYNPHFATQKRAKTIKRVVIFILIFLGVTGILAATLI
jgi:hypothetical protein